MSVMNSGHTQAIEVGYGIAQGPSAVVVGIEAAQKAMSPIEKFNVSAVLVFAAATYDLSAVLHGIRQVVGEVPVFGAMAAGEIFGTIHQDSVTVVVLASPYLRVHCGLGTNVSGDWRRALDEAIESPAVQPFFADREHLEKLRRQGREYFVMLFTPGITKHTEYHGFEIIEALKEKTGGGCPIVGGGATDEHLNGNHILFGQQAYVDSVLLVVFETELQFGISLTHGFKPTDTRAKVTAVDGAEVLTIDGHSAVDVYSRLIGVPKEMTDIHPSYMVGDTLGISEPLGQYTVNVVDALTPRGGLRLCKTVSADTVLIKMDSTPANLAQAGPDGIRQAVIRGGITDIALCLVCYCALRPKLLGSLIDQEFAAMQEVLADSPLVGFLCCAEVGLEADGVSRLNRSSIASLVLGSQLSPLARIMSENNQLLAELTSQSDVLSRTNQDLLKEIYQRKKAEEALRESEERYRQLFYSSQDAKVLVEAKTGAITDVNQAAIEYYGYSADEARKLRIYDISLTAPATIRKFANDFSDTHSRFATARHRLRSGEIRDVEIQVQLIRIAGKKHFCFAVTDITARRQAEADLAQSRDRLAVVVEGAKAGICEWDMLADKVYYDKRWQEIIGYQEGELAGTYEEWSSRWHPDDTAAIEKALSDHLAGATDKLLIEYRLRHKDGSYRWVHTGGKFTFDAGRPIRWIGYNIDITDNKRGEEFRADSEKLLRDFAKAIPATACIVDEDGRYVDIISDEDRVLEKARDELVGRTLHEVLPAEIADKMVAGIRQAISTGKPRQRIYESDVNGRWRVVDVRAAPMEYVVNGKKTVATVVLDITEQRENQKRLQFVYDLRRTSSFMNDIISGNTPVDDQAFATTLRYAVEFNRPLVCCLLVLEKAVNTNRSLDIHMMKNDIIYALGEDSRYLVWACREGIGALWQVDDPTCERLQSAAITADLAAKIAHCAPNLTLRIGVSKVNTGTDSIAKGYRQAWSAVVAARAQAETSGAVTRFGDLGIYQLLANIGGQNQANEFVRQKIGPIIEYDCQKGTDYLRTLEEILQSTNLKEAADKLYIHHKTIIFRKQRIEKMLGASVDHFEEKLALAAAIKLSKLSDTLRQ